MKKLASTTKPHKIEVYVYDSYEEYQKHYNSMVADGWCGSSLAKNMKNWMTSYRKESMD